MHIQVQIEMCGMTFPGQPFDAQLMQGRSRHRLPSFGLVIEHDLE